MLGGLIFQRKIDVMIVQFMIPASEELVQPSTCQFFVFFFFLLRKRTVLETVIVFVQCVTSEKYCPLRKNKTLRTAQQAHELT